MKGFGRLKLFLGIFILLLSVNAVVAACPDFDNDNSVGFNDFFLFSQYFNWQVNDTTKVYDVDGNNAIDFDDFFLFSAAFGKKCDELAQTAQPAQTPQLEQPATLVLPKPDACQQNIEECKKQVSYILAGAQKVAKLEDGRFAYYHSDHLGSTSKMTDENGNVVFSADYLPFGEELRKDGDEKFTYTGKELDEESGLYYYGARYYDAEIGRFTSVDPMPDADNRYVYVKNNPIRLTDPDGREVDPDNLRHIASVGMEDVIKKGTAYEVEVRKAYEEFKSAGKGGVEEFIAVRNRVARDPGKVAAAVEALKSAKAEGGVVKHALVLTKLREAKSLRDKVDMIRNLVRNSPGLINELGETLAQSKEYATELKLLEGIAKQEAKQVTKTAGALAGAAARAKPPGLMAMGGGGILNLVIGVFTGEVKVEDKPQTQGELAAKGSSQKIENFRAAFYTIWGADPAKYMTDEDKAKIDPKFKYQPSDS